jgi:hypothetical protein
MTHEGTFQRRHTRQCAGRWRPGSGPPARNSPTWKR